MKTDLELTFDILSDPTCADQSCGDTQAPTGFFALISIPDDESLKDTRKYIEMIDETINTSELEVGHYVVVFDSIGFIYPSSFDTYEDALKDYEALSEEFEKWDTNNFGEWD